MTKPPSAPVRQFSAQPGRREKTPILVGLVGPSGAGKTFSALRLATGMQRVTGGEIFVLDTEARRALHYANDFKFTHVPFGAPFSPQDYAAAIQFCVDKGASTIVVDSMSHEHEGPGGVLEWHDAEWAKKNYDDKNNMTAWIKPKAARRRLINTILQIPANFVFCFRAKEKMKIVTGKQPEHLGWQAIAGEEFVFEMTLKCLLLPGADGFPEWKPEFSGEKVLAKLPRQFRDLFAQRVQLSEDVGERLAKWAGGDSASTSAPVTAAELLGRYAACSDPATFRQINDLAQQHWKALSHKAELKKARDDAESRLARSSETSTSEPTAEERAEIERLEREGR